ncbi:MAG: metal ABC transporter ATP-binding protein [Bowdeniella nasicola]|nr:metal ABC transporter ATP-binding protein [Bowdeniella nasicola]
MTAVQPALQLSDMAVAYHDVLALSHVDLAVKPGTIMGVVGPNGAGKSTLIKGSLGLVPPLHGDVRFFGERLDDVRERVGYLPQHSSVDWDFPATVSDVALMGTFSAKRWWARTTAADRDAAARALDQVGLTELAHRQIGELSGGQRQRAFLARVLAHKADLYFMDEPFAGVDIASQETITRVLHELRAEGATIVVVHHDLASIPNLCDEVALIDGTVVASGPLEEVFTRDLIDRTYGLAQVDL